MTLPSLKALLFASIGCISITAVSDIIIAWHTFDEPSGDLNGFTIDTIAAGVSTTWLANSSSFDRDGTITGGGSGNHRSASIDIGDVINNARDAVDTSTAIFTLTTEFTSLSTGSPDGWIASGFGDGTMTVNDSFADPNAGLAWTLWDQAPTLGRLLAFDGPGTSAGSTELGVDNSGGVTIRTVLDFSSYDGVTDFGSIAYSFNGGSETTSSFTGDHDFGQIAIALFQGTGGSVSSFELVQVPEPSSFLLVAMAGLAGFLVYRRRR